MVCHQTLVPYQRRVHRGRVQPPLVWSALPTAVYSTQAQVTNPDRHRQHPCRGGGAGRLPLPTGAGAGGRFPPKRRPTTAPVSIKAGFPLPSIHCPPHAAKVHRHPGRHRRHAGPAASRRAPRASRQRANGGLADGRVRGRRGDPRPLPPRIHTYAAARGGPTRRSAPPKFSKDGQRLAAGVRPQPRAQPLRTGGGGFAGPNQSHQAWSPPPPLQHRPPAHRLTGASS